MNSITNISAGNSHWNDSYLLNITQIDKQHKIFFKLFDELLVLNNQIDKDDEIKDFIVELQKYSINHFRTEEALMRNAAFPGMELHIIQHDLFIRKIDEFMIAYNYKNPILLGQMITFMRKWLLMHISDEDSKYVLSIQKYLIEKRIN